jgi:hypothetical protein
MASNEKPHRACGMTGFGERNSSSGGPNLAGTLPRTVLAGFLARGSSYRQRLPIPSCGTVARCGFRPHSQWRARCGITPHSLSTPEGAPKRHQGSEKMLVMVHLHSSWKESKPGVDCFCILYLRRIRISSIFFSPAEGMYRYGA